MAITPVMERRNNTFYSKQNPKKLTNEKVEVTLFKIPFFRDAISFLVSFIYSLPNPTAHEKDFEWFRFGIFSLLPTSY